MIERCRSRRAAPLQACKWSDGEALHIKVVTCPDTERVLCTMGVSLGCLIHRCHPWDEGPRSVRGRDSINDAAIYVIVSPSKAKNAVNIELVSGIVGAIDRKTKTPCINPTSSRSVFKTQCIEINVGRHVVEGNTQDKIVSEPIVCAKCRPERLKLTSDT